MTAKARTVGLKPRGNQRVNAELELEEQIRAMHAAAIEGDRMHCGLVLRRAVWPTPDRP